MARTIRFFPLSVAFLLLGCGTTTPTKEAAKAPAPEGNYRIYIQWE